MDIVKTLLFNAPFIIAGVIVGSIIAKLLHKNYWLRKENNFLKYELKRDCRTVGSKTEYILCAAIHFDDGEEHLYQPENIETGIVLCGHRHACIFPHMLSQFKEEDNQYEEKEQGFLTNKNRFVDRFEAGKIAFEAGQTKTLINYLHSEDLY